MDSRTSLAVISSAEQWTVLREQANVLLKSGYLPGNIKTPEQAIAIVLTGQELGVSPTRALSGIAIINGKPTISAELMAVLIYRDHGGEALDFEETTNERCTIAYRRRGAAKVRRYTFTIEDATKASLAGKDTWRQYPAAMLRARCISAVARMAFPDTIAGCYTPEEMGAQVRVVGDEVEIAEPAPLQLAPAPLRQLPARVVHATAEDVMRATPVAATVEQHTLIARYANELLTTYGERVAIPDDLTDVAADELISELISKLADLDFGQPGGPPSEQTTPAPAAVTESQRTGIKAAIDAFAKRGRTIKPPPSSFNAAQVEQWLGVQREELQRVVDAEKATKATAVASR